MTTDFSFIRLTKNDFALAKRADDPNIATLLYQGFIVQKPNETFLQISASDTDIAFVGGIQVDLIDCNGLIIRNIDANFYYEGFVDANGISQIAFEFGNIGVDYWTKPLYLKITDLVNDNVYYSNGFLVTNYRGELTTRFDYTNQTKIHNISYDLAPYTQSVRLFGCYDNTPVNKREVRQYVTSQGKQTNYRNITTFLRQYYIDKLDYFVNDRLEVLFSHGVIYCNGQRVTVSEYSIEERKGTTNWFNGEFIINPQGELFTFEYQLYEALEVVDRLPEHLGAYTLTSLPDISLTFNKNITLVDGFVIKLYKGGVLQTITPTVYTVTDNLLEVTPTYTFTNGSYSIIIEPNLIYNEADYWQGFGATEWTFDIIDGEFEATEFDNDEFLTN